jgi:hypothetical protein
MAREPFDLHSIERIPVASRLQSVGANTSLDGRIPNHQIRIGSFLDGTFLGKYSKKACRPLRVESHPLFKGKGSLLGAERVRDGQ